MTSLNGEVEQVVLWGLRVPLGSEERFSYAQGHFDERFACIVSVSSQGVTGWGEAFVPGELVVDGVGLIAASIIGRDLGSSSARLTRRLLEFSDFGRNGLFLRALSGVTNAVGDLKARLYGLPAWEMLGGALNSEVKGYATGFYRRAGDEFGPLLDEMAARVSDGFGMLKLKGGFGVSRDAALLAAARRELGDDIKLAFDVNRAYSEREAIMLIGKIEEHDVEWLEEPTAPTAVSSYARLRSRSSIPISSGESFSGRSEFITFFEAGALDIAQPNVGVVGGVQEAQRVASAGAAFNVETIPHSWGTEVALAATLSLCVTLESVPGRLEAPTQLVEVDCSPNPLRAAFAELTWPRTRDVFTLSEVEGTGVTVNSDALDAIIEGGGGIKRIWST